MTSGAGAPDYRLQQRDYLLRIARAMTARLDLKAVLSLVIESAVEMTHGQSGAIAMRQPDGRRQVVASFGLVPQHALDLAGTPPRLAGLLAAPAAAANDRPAGARPAPLATARDKPAASAAPNLPALGSTLTDADLGMIRRDAPTVLALADDEGRGQVLALPLEVAGEDVGLILVFRSAGAAVFTPLDTELLDDFADQAAVAIHNARLHERLVARERELAAIVHYDPSGVLLLDGHGHVRDCNPALRRLTGAGGAVLVNRSLAEVLPLVDDGGRPLALPLPAGEAPTALQGWLRQADGGRGAYVQVTVVAVRTPSGVADGYVADVVDLSAYRASEDAKNVFLAGLSHELKTPLALIRGYAETLRMPAARSDPALFDDAVDVILDETNHLTAMVEQLLTAARFQSGAVGLRFDEVDLAGLLRRLVGEFAHTQPERDWSLRLPDDLPPVVADPARLREVFQNLLANAAKYSEPGTPVMVTGSLGEGEVVVTVADHGMGIAPEDQGRIFERFVRATDRAEGAGLGLYMCRVIVEAHGGRVTVASAPGVGSAFTVHLPLGPADGVGAAGDVHPAGIADEPADPSEAAP